MNDIVMYGVCVLIVIAAVLLTSLVKIAVKFIVKKCGKELPSTVKEYIFTPMAVGVAGLGVFFWLKDFCGCESETFLYLMTGLAGTGTTIVYLAIFQPTRKLAIKIIQWICQRIDIAKAAKALKETMITKEVSVENIKSCVKKTKDNENISAAELFEKTINSLKSDK